MKLLKLLNASVIGVVLVNFSCETEVTPPDLRDIQDKLVINSIIYPEMRIIEVEVSVSKKSFGSIARDFEILENAVVTISNGTIEKAIPYDTFNMKYRIPTSDFPLVEGSKYVLNVNAKDMQVFAETTIPKKVERLVSYDFINEKELNVKWKDFEEEGNYYRISASDFFNEGGSAIIPNRRLLFDSDEFISDRIVNNKIISASGELDGSQEINDGFIVNIVSSSQIYSDYFRILKNYDEDNLFSEPTPLPSNINGGLGIFAGVQWSQFVIKSEDLRQ